MLKLIDTDTKREVVIDKELEEKIIKEIIIEHNLATEEPLMRNVLQHTFQKLKEEIL